MILSTVDAEQNIQSTLLYYSPYYSTLLYFTSIHSNSLHSTLIQFNFSQINKLEVEIVSFSDIKQLFLSSLLEEEEKGEGKGGEG